MSKNKFLFIDFVKCIAVVLVLNSHMDGIYPISALATGGAIGNGLFFFASGFLSTNIRLPFGKWYLNRIKRLIPMTSVMALIRIVILGRFQISTAFIDIIFPTYYWFVAAILLFDIPLYFLVKKKRYARYKFPILLILTIIYFAYYFLLLDTTKWVVESSGLTSIEGCFKLIYYFAIMLCGAEMRLNIDDGKKSNSNDNRPEWNLLIMSVLCFLVFYGYKILMNRYTLFMKLQFIEQIMTAFTVVWFCQFLYSSEYVLKKYSDNNVMNIIEKVSSISLELFLTQEIIVIFARRIKFPVSFIVMVVGTFASAIILNVIYKQLRQWIAKRNS